MQDAARFERLKAGYYVSGEWRIVHARREENLFLSLWCADRLNTDGIRWVSAETFDTLAEAKAYVATMPGHEDSEF